MKGKERAAPVWCKYLMEFSLWAAIFTGVFLAQPLGSETTLVVCAVCMALLTLAWLLHCIYLRWIPIALSFSSLAGIALVVYFLVAHREILGDNRMILAVCLPVFVAIPGAFTERQVSRFLAFLCAIGGIQVLFCLLGPTMFENKESLSKSLEEGGTILGTLDSEVKLTAFLVCTACAALSFAVWAMARLTPEHNPTAPGGQANRLASPGANLALLGFLSFLLSMLALFLCRGIFAFATFVLIGVLLALLLAVRGHLSAKIVIGLLIVLILLGAVNLSRPVPNSEGLSSDTLNANLTNLTTGIGERYEIIAGHETASGYMVGDPAGPEGSPAEERTQNVWHRLFDASDWGTVFRLFGSTDFLLIAVFFGLLLIEGMKSHFTYRDLQPILLGGALAGLLGLALIGSWGNFLSNPGLALLAAAFCAMTASGGEYDEEFEEIEILS